MADIETMHPGTGRRLKEDNTTVNIADLIEQMANIGITLTEKKGAFKGSFCNGEEAMYGKNGRD